LNALNAKTKEWKVSETLVRELLRASLFICRQSPSMAFMGLFLIVCWGKSSNLQRNFEHPSMASYICSLDHHHQKSRNSYYIWIHSELDYRVVLNRRLSQSHGHDY